MIIKIELKSELCYNFFFGGGGLDFDIRFQKVKFDVKLHVYS